VCGKGEKNLVWFGAKGQKTYLVFDRGVRIYRYISEIVRGRCFLDKKRLFYEKKRFSIKFDRRFVESRNLNLCVVFCPTLVQSGFSVLEVQPIRCFPSPTLVQSGFWGWDFSQSGAFALPLSSNQVFRG
jgi:hypothetical protein